MRKGETFFSDFDKTIKKRFHLFDCFGGTERYVSPFRFSPLAFFWQKRKKKRPTFSRLPMLKEDQGATF